MSGPQPEWLSLPEAVAALHWLEPMMARRLIGEALSDGRLQDRPVHRHDPLLLHAVFGFATNEIILPESTGAGAWQRWVKSGAIDWDHGEVHRPVFKTPYCPQLSHAALLVCFPPPGVGNNKKPHRPSGTGLAKADESFVEGILSLVRQGLSVHAAATKIVGDGSHIAGGGTAESKTRRLVDQTKKRLLEKHGE